MTLFGSRGRGDARQTSDYDRLVIVDQSIYQARIMETLESRALAHAQARPPEPSREHGIEGEGSLIRAAISVPRWKRQWARSTTSARFRRLKR